jgi:hypothetical protein
MSAVVDIPDVTGFRTSMLLLASILLMAFLPFVASLLMLASLLFLAFPLLLASRLMLTSLCWRAHR